MALFFLSPIRCRKCSHRSYRFTSPVATFAVPAALLTAAVFAAVVTYHKLTEFTPPIPSDSISVTGPPTGIMLDNLFLDPSPVQIKVRSVKGRESDSVQTVIPPKPRLPTRAVPVIAGELREDRR